MAHKIHTIFTLKMGFLGAEVINLTHILLILAMHFRQLVFKIMAHLLQVNLSFPDTLFQTMPFPCSLSCASMYTLGYSNLILSCMLFLPPDHQCLQLRAFILQFPFLCCQLRIDLFFIIQSFSQLFQLGLCFLSHLSSASMRFSLPYECSQMRESLNCRQCCIRFAFCYFFLKRYQEKGQEMIMNLFNVLVIIRPCSNKCMFF